MRGKQEQRKAGAVDRRGNIDDGTSCNFNAVADQTNSDPLLGSLTNNGGPTLTMEPGAGSPAIDQADSSACPSTDQRGVSRPQGPRCDIGAVERRANDAFYFLFLTLTRR